MQHVQVLLAHVCSTFKYFLAHVWKVTAEHELAPQTIEKRDLV
jgi:hypothetical protein